MALLDKIKKLFGKKTPKRNKDTGSALERYYKSFLHAIDGIIYATKYEHNINYMRNNICNILWTYF